VIIRRAPRRRNFTIVTNLAIDNSKLSFATLGVLVFILRQREGAPIGIKELAGKKRGGRDLVSKALKELEAEGYLERVRLQGPRGRWRTEMIVHDEPG